MVKYIIRVMSIVLLTVMLISMVSCNEDNENQINGIKITEDAPYSENALESARRTVRSLIENYYKSVISQNIPENMANKISIMTDRIVEITAEKPMSEDTYLDFIGELHENGDDAISEFITFKETGEGGLEKTKELYLTLSSMLGSDYVGETLYEIILYVYDYKYEDRMTKYLQYGYSYLKSEAEQLSNEKAVLVNEVGKAKFSDALRLSLAMSEIFLGGAFESDKMSSFSNKEILAFLQSLGISEMDISAEGWALFLSKVLPEYAGESYSSKLLAKIKENGDISVLKYVVLYTVDSLNVIEKLSADDIFVIREGGKIQKLELIFSKFGDKEWENIEKIGALEFKNEEYDQIATKLYGREYEEYVNSLQPVTVEQLRLSVGEEGFYDMLTNYLATICPAFGYLS